MYFKLAWYLIIVLIEDIHLEKKKCYLTVC